MKKRDWLVIGIVLMLAAGVGLFSWMNRKPAQSLRISVDGEIYGEYALSENQEIKIGSTNVCIIEDGKVRMIEANCPDQICMHTAEISQDGMTIVCLPNRIVLEIIDETDQKEEEQIDGISS